MTYKHMLMLLLIISSLSCSTESEDNRVLAESGIIDFTGIDLHTTSWFKLNGEWEFFRNKLLSIKQDETSDSEVPEYIDIPISWDDNTLHYSQGFGTYRLKVYGLVPDSIYHLYIPVITTSYSLWVDGKLLARNGVVGENMEDSLPDSSVNFVSFYAKNSETEIIIHVSNYKYRSGSIDKNIFLGSQASSKFKIMNKNILVTFIVGILLSMALFRVKLYYSRSDRNKTDIYFAIIYISLVMLLMVEEVQLIRALIPIIPWSVCKHLEIVFFYLPGSVFLLMLSELYPKEANKYIHNLFFVLFPLLFFLIVFLPREITYNVLQYSSAIIIMFFIYVFYTLICAIKNRRPNAVFYALTILGISLLALSYVFYNYYNILIPYISLIGYMVILFVQSNMLIIRFSKSFKQRESLAKSRDKYKYASLTDALTGLYNVRYLNTFLRNSISSAKVNNSTLSVIMIDIDNFKNYNDTYGHKKGDVVLKELATVIKSSARDVDAPCRYGGEEFTLILTSASKVIAGSVAERIRHKFELLGYSTISLGVSELLPGENGDQIITRADTALYEAKNSGKNRVVLG